MSPPAFTVPALPLSSRRAHSSKCTPRRPPPCMATKGFGKQSEPAPRPKSEGAKSRDAAAERLQAMRGQNAPEYSIWLRLDIEEEKEESGPGGKFPWLPVGSMTIPRGADISKAIFNEDVFADLLSGAKKMFPNLKDYPEEDIQVGYKMKDEADDEGVKLATRPSDNLMSKIQGFFKR